MPLSKKITNVENEIDRLFEKKEPAKISTPVKLTDEERRKRDNERKRLWREKQKALHMESLKQSIQEDIEAEPEKKHWRIRVRRKPKAIETPVAKEPEPLPDVSTEQKEMPMTTVYSPESLKENEISDAKRNPEDYVEINMIKKTRVVDAFYIKAEKKVFHYKKLEYQVKEDSIYLLPTKTGMFMPTCYYHEGKNEPTGFKQTNKGITGKALSLLYMEQLYTSLLYSEDIKYNFFIVILSIVTLIAYGIGCYFVFFHNGGLLPQPETPTELPPAVIMPVKALWGLIHG